MYAALRTSLTPRPERRRVKQLSAPIPSLCTRLGECNRGATGRKAVIAKWCFVIDDEPDVCTAIGEFLEINGWAVETYSSGEAFLETDYAVRRGCVLVDAHMPGMGGLELLQRLKGSTHRLPAIMMTGNGNIRMAVSAMKAGALDFIEKPLGCRKLLSSINRASETMGDVSGLTTSRGEAVARATTLTPRQRQIMDLVLAGRSSRNIAADLGLSQRAVEKNRAVIMEMMGATSIVALARLGIAAS